MSLKIDRINGAYSQLRISGLTVQPTPEDLELALDRLESMMAELEGRNIGVGYNFEEQPDPNSPSNVSREFYQMIDTNLAIRMIPDFNKPVPQTLMLQATQSLSNASGRVAANLVQEVRYPSRQPRGSGNTLRYNRWNRFYREGANAPTESATNQMFIGDINDYVESWESYLADGEAISSYVIDADKGFDLVSDSQVGDSQINYRIEALDTVGTGSFQQVKITVTTDGGRKNTRIISFELSSNETVDP